MRTFNKISLGALFIALAASPAFAQLASQTYVERKASVSETAAADVGKIAVYAADGSGQKIVSGILANTLLTTSDLTEVGLNGATAATGTFNFYAPLTSGTTGQVLKAVTGGAPTWGTDLNNITTATTTGSGNAVTAVSADAAGALTITKGQTFLTSADLPAEYVLPAATTTALGGIKLKQAADASAATLESDSATAGRSYRVKLDNSSIAYVNVPWTDLDHITTATTTGAGNAVTSVTADAAGALTITKGATFLTSFTETDPSIDTTVMTTAANAVGTTGTTGKVYPIQKNASGNAVVSVPWSDTNNRAFNGPSTAGTAAAYTLATTQPAFTASDLTAGSIVVATIHATNSASPTLSVGGQTAKPIFMIDTGAAAGASALAANTTYSFTYNGTNWYAKQIDTNTTYTGTAPITVTGTTISHNTSGVSAAAYGPTANATLTSGGTFTVPSFTVDTNGHTTVAATRTMTMPTIPVDTNTAANLNTTNTTAQTTSASESLLSGTVNLHKVAKTGTFSDLIGAPSIPAIPTICTAANATCSLNYGQCTAAENATGVACSGAQYYWEVVIR